MGSSAIQRTRCAPFPGGIIVPRALIRELQLRPGLMLRGNPKGRTLNKLDSIEGRSPDEWISRTTLYDATALESPSP